MTKPNPRHHGNPKSGFTLAEMMISTVIMLFIVLTSASIATNFFNSIRNIQAANMVYDETNFTMERIIKEIRSGTIDYEEYYNQSANFFGTETNETYGKNYCQYSRQFYGAGPDGKYGTFDDESTGERKMDSPPPVTAPIQKKLYLIDATGTRRTYVQRVEIQRMDINNKPFGDPIGKVAILKLDGKDYGINHMPKGVNTPQCKDSGEGDGLIDTWVCAKGFKCGKNRISFTTQLKGVTYPCEGVVQTPYDTPEQLNNVDNMTEGVDNTGKSSFVDITPETIDVVSLDFIVSPSDDPRKAYNNADLQVQPSVTLKMVTRATPEVASTFRGSTPTIALESTISARAAKEIITECNLQECIDGDKKSCPKRTGILVNAVQFCSQGVWPGCSETDYENFSANYLKGNQANINALGIKGSESDGSLTPAENAAIFADGKDHNEPFYATGRSFYESTGSETGSCVTKDAGGKEISDDLCKARRCSDGVDNDVNGKADQNDPACLFFLCNNGYKDPGEECADIGGICQFMPQHRKTEKETSCSDGYDNDCSYVYEWGLLSDEQEAKAIGLGFTSSSSMAEVNIALGLGADEYDQHCIDLFCGNGVRDPVPGNGFGPKFYDTPFYLKAKTVSSELNEECVDIGGLCEQATGGGHKKKEKEYDPLSLDPAINSGNLCYDGLDNDCDYVTGIEPNPIGDPNSGGADEFDADCKPVICGNASTDQKLADINIIKLQAPPAEYFYDYLVKYLDDLGSESDLDEECKNVGGLCGGTVPENTVTVCGGGSGIKCMCFDGIDNDCVNGIDGVVDRLINFKTDPKPDSSCCPDGDGDGFAAYTATCHPAKAKDDPDNPNTELPGFIDCDDTNPAIYPGAPELCGDKDGSGKDIDSNCSGRNGIDGGFDYEENSCCVDSDGDGYGLQDANLTNTATGRCLKPNSTLVDFNERTPYDCKDNETPPGAVNPGVAENTKALCMDGINNSCRFVKDPVSGMLDQLREKKDHIDLYATDAVTLLAALNDQRFNPDCCPTDPVKLAEFYGAGSAAANHPGMEICDDEGSLLCQKDPADPACPMGSDENCNGLEGYDDRFCVDRLGTSFFDNLNSMAYLDAAATTAEIDLVAGVAKPHNAAIEEEVVGKGIPIGVSCAKVTEVTLYPTSDLTGGTILYQASNSTDAGGLAIWQDPDSANPGDPLKFTFPGNGNTLQWKAILEGDGTDYPTLGDLKLTWTCG